MAIRLRWVRGEWVALCAAKSEPEDGDLYLDDGQHHALGSKFAKDFHAEGFYNGPLDEAHDRLVEAQRGS